MAMSILCPSCSVRLKVEETSVNKVLKCPRCRTAIAIAQPAMTPPTDADAATEPMPADPTPVAPAPSSPPPLPDSVPGIGVLSRWKRWSRRKRILVGAGCVWGFLVLMAVCSGPSNLPVSESSTTPSSLASTGSVPTSPTAAPMETYVPQATPAGNGFTFNSQPEPVVTFGPDPAVDQARRQFLQQEIARLQVAVQQDQDFLQKNGIGTALVRGLGQGADAYGRRSTNPNDALLGPIAKGLTEGIAGEAERARATALSRLNANQQLLQQYQGELNRLGPPPL